MQRTERGTFGIREWRPRLFYDAAVRDKYDRLTENIVRIKTGKMCDLLK